MGDAETEKMGGVFFRQRMGGLFWGSPTGRDEKIDRIRVKPFGFVRFHRPGMNRLNRNHVNPLILKIRVQTIARQPNNGINNGTKTQHKEVIMEFLLDKIKMLVNMLLFHPRSTTTSLILLLFVIAIAVYVNRKRDASGKVSFVDRTRTGVVGLRLYETEEGQRKRNWLIPLWMPESNLLLTVRMLLPKGEYDVRAFWRADIFSCLKDGVFTAQPVQKLSVYNLSDLGKFKVSADMPVEFKLSPEGKKAQIDSPNKSLLEFAPDKPPFPLMLSDSAMDKLGAKLEKAKKEKLWELSIVDERIMSHLEYEVKSLSRKLDGMTIKNKELESNMDGVCQKLKTLQKDSGAEKKTAG
jgi:hypothetical protein